MAAPLAMSLSVQAMLHPTLGVQSASMTTGCLRCSTPAQVTRSGVLRMEDKPPTFADYKAKTDAGATASDEGTRDSAPSVESQGSVFFGSVSPAAPAYENDDASGNKVEADGNRRNLLKLSSGLAAALLLSKSTDILTVGQKTIRPLVSEPLADAAQAKMFPTAMLSADLDAAVYKTLSLRGFSPENTLFAHSVCSDEVNGKEEELVDRMMDRWGEGFSLGGLAGLPFAGKSGFRAYLHHVPDNGKLLIMFAPHVGIDKDGRIGGLQRDGQDAVSKACGAAIGAFKAIKAANAAPPKAPEGASDKVLAIPDVYDDFDPQIQQIVGLLKPRMEGLEDSANDIGFVTYQMYGIVRDLVDACIKGTPDLWDWTGEIALVGGVMINRKGGGDFFQPLSFETRTPDKTTDLYEKTFGRRPDLTPAIGSKGVERGIYGSSTLSGLSKSIRAELPAL